jgi:hypothetical protein
MRRRRELAGLVLVGLVLAGSLIALLAVRGRPVPPLTAANHVGDATCLACHAEQATFGATAHHLTSAEATSRRIQGDFREDHNILRTANPHLYFRMDSTADGFFQRAIVGLAPNTSVQSERFDLVVGSGRKGQSYLYWRDGDRLFQLPVSHWTELGDWVNSPGYRDGVLNFNRPVAPRCLECHASYFETAEEELTTNRYDTENYILGISCETCHGSGEQHVARQQAGTATIFGQAIINPARLPRQRQLEACALCHGGLGEPLAPAFTYLPGRPLVDHLRLRPPLPGEPVDVHGNQVGLLEQSPCFRASTMTCSTCHNVHLPQRRAADFTANCLSCHVVESCGLFPERGHQLARDCVSCHMPNQRSHVIISTTGGVTIQPRVRNHRIGIYPEESSR